jgi:bacterioferritin
VPQLGYHVSVTTSKKQSIDEMKHAESLIRTHPVSRLDAEDGVLELNVGGNVQQQIEADLALEINAVAMYRQSHSGRTRGGRRSVRELFRSSSRRGGTRDWLEAQVHQIKEMGYERYLTLHVEGPKD